MHSSGKTGDNSGKLAILSTDAYLSVVGILSSDWEETYNIPGSIIQGQKDKPTNLCPATPIVLLFPEVSGLWVALQTASSLSCHSVNTAVLTSTATASYLVGGQPLFLNTLTSLKPTEIFKFIMGQNRC